MFFLSGKMILCGDHSKLSNQHLKIGLDIGIISYADNQVEGMIFGGITMIPTGFTFMGKLAAKCIKKRKKYGYDTNPF